MKDEIVRWEAALSVQRIDFPFVLYAYITYLAAFETEITEKLDWNT